MVTDANRFFFAGVLGNFAYAGLLFCFIMLVLYIGDVGKLFLKQTLTAAYQVYAGHDLMELADNEVQIRSHLTTEILRRQIPDLGLQDMQHRIFSWCGDGKLMLITEDRKNALLCRFVIPDEDTTYHVQPTASFPGHYKITLDTESSLADGLSIEPISHRDAYYLIPAADLAAMKTWEDYRDLNLKYERCTDKRRLELGQGFASVRENDEIFSVIDERYDWSKLPTADGFLINTLPGVLQGLWYMFWVKTLVF